MKRFPAMVLVALGFLASFASAAPLDDRIPKDALVYAGWRGADALAPEYAQSNLKAVLDTAGLHDYIQQQLPHWMDLAGQQDADAPAQIKDALSGLDILWRHPCALYIGPADFPHGGPGDPKPRVAFLCDAGTDAPALLASVQKLIEKSDAPAEAKLAVAQDGNVVIVTLGVSTAGDFAVHADALKSSTVFQKAMGHISPTSAFTLFADPAATLQMLDAALAAEPDVPPEIRQKYETTLKALGLRNLGQIIFGAGFEKKGWTQQAFVGITGPKTGLLTLVDNGALDESHLAAIPNEAVAFQAVRFDLSKLLATARQIAGEIDTEALQNLNSSIEAANQQLGFDVEKDFIGALGDHWITYQTPSPDGVGMVQAFVMKVKDGGALTNSLKTICTQVAAASEGKAQVQQAEVDGIPVTEVNVPMVSIAWTIRGDCLYVSSAAGISAAVNQVEKKQPSILTNQAYLTARAQLPKVQPQTLSYSDPSKIYPELYRTAATFLPFLSAVGINVPVQILPNPVKSAPYLTPGASEMWTGDDGVYFKSVSSVPGAE